MAKGYQPKTYQSIQQAIGVVEAKEKKRLVDRWEYRNIHGELVLVVIRLEDEKGSKSYRPLHPRGRGWVLGDPPGKLPLYRLDRLAGAKRVLVLEGEKAADAAVKLGYEATTSAHGANSPTRTDWGPLARAEEVVILPDNDLAGSRYARKVAETLFWMNRPPTIKVLWLEGLDPHGDLVDYLELMRTTYEQTRGTMTKPFASLARGWLDRLIEQTEPWQPETVRESLTEAEAPPAAAAGPAETDAAASGAELVYAASGRIVEPDKTGTQTARTPGMVRVRMVRQRLSEVQAEQVQWLWPGRVPLGKLTILAGDPGLGKSFLTMMMAATVSTGCLWPDAFIGDPGPDADEAAKTATDLPAPGSCLILSAEDGLADTIRPRLDAAGADCERVEAVTMVHDEQLGERGVNLESDLLLLEMSLAEMVNPRLIIIDPLSAYLGRINSHRNTDVRGVLAPLSRLAEKLGIAIVGVTHLNKAAGMSSAYRTIGSIAFTAAARAVWMVFKDKRHPARRLMLAEKSNLASCRSGLAFSINDGRLAFEPEPVNLTAAEIMGDFGDLDNRDMDCHPSKHQQARDWLEAALAEGPVPSRDLQHMAEEEAIAWGTIKKVKKEMRIESTKEFSGGEHKWVWSLPVHA